LGFIDVDLELDNFLERAGGRKSSSVLMREASGQRLGLSMATSL